MGRLVKFDFVLSPQPLSLSSSCLHWPSVVASPALWSFSSSSCHAGDAKGEDRGGKGMRRLRAKREKTPRRGKTKTKTEGEDEGDRERRPRITLPLSVSVWLWGSGHVVLLLRDLFLLDTSLSPSSPSTLFGYQTRTGWCAVFINRNKSRMYFCVEAADTKL